jgi:hypothetical protein
MHVPVKDLAPILQRALRGVDYHRADIEIEPREEVTLGVAGGDGQRGFAIMVDMSRDSYETMRGSWGGSNMFAVTEVDDSTGVGKLPPHGALIKGTTGYPRTYATVYCHPDMMKLLPSGNEEALTEDQQWLLNVHCGFTSAYRKELITRRQGNDVAV